MMIQERCWADLRDYRPITLLLLRCNYFYDDWTIDCTDSIRFRSRNMDNHPYEKIDTSPMFNVSDGHDWWVMGIRSVRDFLKFWCDQAVLFKKSMPVSLREKMFLLCRSDNLRTRLEHAVAWNLLWSEAFWWQDWVEGVSKRKIATRIHKNGDDKSAHRQGFSISTLRE